MKSSLGQMVDSSGAEKEGPRRGPRAQTSGSGGAVGISNRLLDESRTAAMATTCRQCEGYDGPSKMTEGVREEG
ncbi:hypothetical protein AAHA92_29325 [Salvia divinorum]|uniref:Uncharacterized protein n=1 Tax=Salvia divinorum TaxID=28513 RepID=A0ABD1G0L6_SALDI